MNFLSRLTLERSFFCRFKKKSPDKLRTPEYLQSTRIEELDSVSVHRGLDEKVDLSDRSPLSKYVFI